MSIVSDVLRTAKPVISTDASVDPRLKHKQSILDYQIKTVLCAPIKLRDTVTGIIYLDNHFSVGPAILWIPFLAVTHGGVLLVNSLGAHIATDGFSKPYRLTMAMSTALYGFLGLLLSFHLARRYFREHWAFIATLGIWFGSSLPVYMYFNPSWSHAHSAFAVALFLWYWERTRQQRSLHEWAILGVLSGLAVDVYYPNGLLLLVPLVEAFAGYAERWRIPSSRWTSIRRLFWSHALYCTMVCVSLLPTVVTRRIIYGSFFRFGYGAGESWHWTSPVLLKILFSSNHGLFSWTPILIPATLGIFLVRRKDKTLAFCLVTAALAFYLLIASYAVWNGISSYGNRFFVSLTPLFILGLAASLEWLCGLFSHVRRAVAVAALSVGLFVVWNLGFIFQWGTQMVPARGPISWQQMVHNQVAVVPLRLTQTLKTYLVRRTALMEQIDQRDLKGLQSKASGNQ